MMMPDIISSAIGFLLGALPKKWRDARAARQAQASLDRLMEAQLEFERLYLAHPRRTTPAAPDDPGAGVHGETGGGVVGFRAGGPRGIRRGS